MNLTVDASVFVASARTTDTEYLTSRQSLQQARTLAADLFCPILVLPECAAAIARSTGDPALAEELVVLVKSFPRLNLLPLDPPRIRRAVQIDTTYLLRGADSVYVAVTEANSATLIAWDAKMLERGSHLVNAMTPSAWLERYTAAE